MVRVLVVEADAAMRRVLTYVLTDQGHTVDAAATGQQALALAKIRPPDAVLLELELGPASLLSGVEVCQHFRSNGLVGPIVCMSAQPATDVAAVVAAAGGSGYLPKPFRIAAFLQHLSDLPPRR